ncbi:MAG: GbsR/MarR family transcriptional regulator [Anaerolineae bacterium]
MSTELDQAREHFVQGMSRISHFWGFPKAMGAIYGVIYLSPDPMPLDELVKQVGVSKGAVSTHVRALERMSMVHKHIHVGDRKDYYFAETDFWKVVRSVLKEREKNEFNRALHTVDESLAMVQSVEVAEDAPLASFYAERLQAMQRFFGSLDNLVATLIALDNLRSGTIRNVFNKSSE